MVLVLYSTVPIRFHYFLKYINLFSIFPNNLSPTSLKKCLIFVYQREKNNGEEKGDGKKLTGKTILKNKRKEKK